MQSNAKFLGHAIHPILIVFPLGLLSTSLVFDGLRVVTGRKRFGEIAKALIGSGLVGGLVAAPFGTYDWLAVPNESRAKVIGLLHGLSNGAALSLFSVSYLLRRKDPGRLRVSALAFSLAGGALAAVGGWLGGELVERLGVGVDDDANVDAPSSLSDLPASATNGQRRRAASAVH